MRLGLDPVQHEPPHGLAHFVEGGIEPAMAVSERFSGSQHQLDKPGARARRVAIVEEFAAGPLIQAGDLRATQAKFAKAGIFGLVHRHATDNVVEIFTRRDRHQQLLGLAKLAIAFKTVGIGGQFGEHAGIGRKPGECMKRMLVAIGEFPGSGAAAGFQKQCFHGAGGFPDQPAKFARRHIYAWVSSCQMHGPVS